jgi:hypothetical protein
VFAAVLAFGLSSGAAQAELWPSFDLGYSAKHATHVVVVNAEGVVLESWRGDLISGTKLPFPAKSDPIPVDYIASFQVTDEADIEFEAVKKTVKSVTGNRRVLFLIRSKNQDENLEAWFPANINEPDIKLATAWIEQGQGFAIYQCINPGPPAKMHPLYLSEATIKKQVLEIAKASTAKASVPVKPAIVAKPKSAVKSASDLAGQWRVLLPEGYEYDITVTALKDGGYHLAPESLTFCGDYQLQDNHLVNTKSPDNPAGRYHWKMNSPYMFTLTKQTSSVGSYYTGAVLFRSRKELALEQ